MTKRQRRIWLGLALLLIIAALLPAVHWRVIGWARGEAFYQGWPTSYWKREVRHYEMVDSFISGDVYFFCPYRMSERQWLKKHLGLDLTDYLGGDPMDTRPLGMRLPCVIRDPQALPVLGDLLGCEDARAQLFAIQSLGEIGPEAKAACPGLRDVVRTTQKYLLYREAVIALSHIEGRAITEVERERPDGQQLFERHQKSYNPFDPLRDVGKD